MPDDSFVVFANNFDRLNADPVDPLVKFNADGTRNLEFHVQAEFTSFQAAAATPDGHLIVAGFRRDKTGRDTFRIQKLNADGSLDANFIAATADDALRSVAIQPDGKILIGGQFLKINGADRPFLVRLNSNGSVDQSFAKISLATLGSIPFSSATGIYAQILVQEDAKIVIGGAFDHINGIAARALARLNSNGTLDTTFVASGYDNAVSGPPRAIRGLAIDSTGRIVASGGFVDPNSKVLYALVALTGDGSLSNFFPDLNDTISTRAIVVMPNDDIVVAKSQLYRYNSYGYPVRGYPKHSFYYDRLGVFIISSSLALQRSGKLIVTGPRYVDDQRRTGVARFFPNGSLDGFYAGEFQAEASINSVASRADGKIYLSGSFDRVDGIPRVGVARLQSDGSLDKQFNSAVWGYSNTYGFVLHPDGRVLFYGDKATRESPYEDQNFSYQRLLPDGQPDPAFQAREPSGTDAPEVVFRDALLEPDGSYFVLNPADADAVFNDTSIGHLLSNGVRDQNFTFGIKLSNVAVVHNKDETVNRIYAGDNRAIAFLQDGRMLVRYFDATGNYKLVRVNPNGAIDPSFAQGAVPALRTLTLQASVADRRQQGFYERVSAITASGAPLSDAVLQPDGKVVVVGMFTKYNAVRAGAIVRLLPNGTVDGSFKAGAGAQWTKAVADATHVPEIDSIEQQPDGKLLIAGNFEAFDGVAAPGIARLNPDGSVDRTFSPPAALQDLPYLAQFPPVPGNRIFPDQNGKYFLTGRYAAPGSEWQHSLLRFNIAAPPLLNISTRASVLGGENVLIGGIIITGAEPKTILLRGIGPSLNVNGSAVPGRVGDPTLQLFSGKAVIAANDNWKDTQEVAIADTGVAPTNELESAIVATLAPGSYTAVLSGKDNTTGIGLVEAYDLNQGANSKLANISTRGFVQTGDQVMIGGFIVGNGSTRVIVRALGPSLAAAGIANTLPDPTLQIFNGSGTLVDSNDDWKSDHQAEIEATTVPPTNDAESAVVRTLPPGNYTAVVSGKSNATGVGLVEVYSIQ